MMGEKRGEWLIGCETGVETAEAEMMAAPATRLWGIFTTGLADASSLSLSSIEAVDILTDVGCVAEVGGPLRKIDTLLLQPGPDPPAL